MEIRKVKKGQWVVEKDGQEVYSGKTKKACEQWIEEQAQPKPEPEPEPETKPEPKKSAVPGHEGSMAAFMDSVLLKGGTWDEMTEQVKAEAKNRGLEEKRYNKGALRAHAKYRIGKGTLSITLTEEGAHA